MIGKNIRELRDQLGLTQEKLAELVGVTRSRINGWEQGYGNPSTEMLIKLKEILNCSYEELIEGKI